MAGKGVPVNGGMPSLLRLSPEEAGAARLLARLETRHPGVTIVTPSWSYQPWRATVDAGTVPGDDRQMIFTAHLPGELLAKLEALFPRPG